MTVPSAGDAAGQYYELDLTGATRSDIGNLVSLPGAPTFGRVLSTALAMKGGVSLAVWIGGAAAEIDLVRRIRIRTVDGATRAYFAADPGKRSPGAAATGYDTSSELEQLPHILARADLYARALVARGYDRLEVDVLAGASAGGLNGILYGVAQRAGTNFDRMIAVWAKAGSAWRLLRGGGWQTVPSALGGDSYFWPEVRKAIADFYGWEPNPDHVTPELSIDLSATIADREYQSTPGSQGRGHFHFVGADDPSDASNAFAPPEVGILGTVGRDIPRDPIFTPGADGLPMNPDVDRLAYAARTTSSFPGAFEPARIWSRIANAADPVVSGDEVEMTFAFSAHRAADPYSVIDGGVLDNIPIDRVQRAIRNRTPRSYSDRVVLYLDPSPDQLPLVRLRPDEADPPSRADHQRRGRPSFLRTISQGITMRGINEDGGREVDDLDAARRAQQYADAREQAYSVGATALARSGADLDVLRERYRIYRAITDLDLLGSALKDPDLWQLTTILPTRCHWEATPEKDVRYLDARFITAYQDPAPGLDAAVRSGSQALRDATLCALDWVRQLDDYLFASASENAVARQHCNDLRIGIHQIARTAVNIRDRGLSSVLSDDDLGTQFSELTGETLARKWIAQESLAPTLALWQSLDAAVDELRSLSGSIAGFATQASPWASLPANSGADWTARDLAPWIAAEGVPDASAFIQYAEIDSAERTADSDAVPGTPLNYPDLREAQLAEIVSGWLGLPTARWKAEATPENLPASLDPAAKLAGSTLGNFGAFFSVAWRRNDWWWGRVDAAAGILRILATLPLHQGTAPTADDMIETRTTIQRLVLRQANVSGSAQRPFPAKVDPTKADADLTIARSFSAGAHTLRQLSPAYLVSVASRASRVAVRAIRSDQSWLIKSLVSLFLPPLLIVTPFAFAPMRAAFAIVTALSLVQLVGSPTGGPDLTRHSSWGEVALAAVAILAGIGGVSGTVTRWTRLAAFEREMPGRPLRARARRSVLISAVLVAVWAAAAVALVVQEVGTRPVDAELVGLAAATAILPYLARSVAGGLASPSHGSSTAIWSVLTVLGALSLFGQGSFLRATVDGQGRVIPAASWLADPSHATAVGVAVIVAVVTWGWVGGFAADWHRLVGLVPWAVLGVASGYVAGWVSSAVIGAIGASHAHQAYTPGFAAALVASLAAWFAAAHVAWWASDALPTQSWADLDTPTYRTPRSAPSP